MKLAEALNRRKEMYQQMQNLAVDILDDAHVEESGITDEKKNEIANRLNALIDLIDARSELIMRINKTNIQTNIVFDGGEAMTLMEAIALRDSLDLKVAKLNEIYERSKVIRVRSKEDVKYFSLVDRVAVKAQHDKFAQTRRMLDILIQETNWLTELL